LKRWWWWWGGYRGNGWGLNSCFLFDLLHKVRGEIADISLFILAVPPSFVAHFVEHHNRRSYLKIDLILLLCCVIEHHQCPDLLGFWIEKVIKMSI
jgi:hypothetical protein